MSAKQDQRMRQALARLELISHGSTAAWNSAGGRDSEHPGGKQPVGEARPPHETLRERYEQARDEMGRELVIQDAEIALRHVTQRRSTTVAGETIGELHARIRKLRGEGWSEEDVSRACRCTRTCVREAMADWLASEVERLARKGKPERVIALELRIPKSTVHDLKRRAA